MPSLEEQDALLEQIGKTEKKRESLIRDLAAIDAEVDVRIRKVVPKVIQNYPSIKIKRAEFIGEVELEDWEPCPDS